MPMPGDVALVSSVAYGVATAARSDRAAGSRVLVLQDDHSSPVLEWMTRAAAAASRRGGAAAGQRRLDRGRARGHEAAGRVPVALASISSVHWSDGGDRRPRPVGAALRAQGAALLVDATHGRRAGDGCASARSRLS